MSKDDIIYRKVKTVRDLELPVDREDAPRVQGFDIPQRANFIITNVRRNKYGIFSHDGGFQPTQDSPYVTRFVHLANNEVIHLSNWQIHVLQKAGRIRPITGPGDGPKNVPGSSFTVTGKKRDKALRMMLYADGFEDYMRENDVWKIPDSEKARIIREIADTIGDKHPPKRSKWYGLLQISRKGNQFDRLIDFVDNDALKGNRTARYGSEITKAIIDAANEAVRTHGDWESIRSLLLHWSRPGKKYAHLRDLIVDDDGICKIPERKFQRTLGNMNRYVYDFLRYGQDHAERVHKRSLAQIRPDAPLAIVDVDHSTLNVVVIDDVYPIVYGKPDILPFRDRNSDINVGYGVSFNNPSYQTFLEGLKHAMFEKDPNQMNGCAYPWHGTPIKLGVDNAKHLVGLNIRAATRELGIQTVAYRAGAPWEKGAEEHLFAILGHKLVHRLPGTTKSNPTERDKYDDEQELAVPVLTMSELRGFLDYYFAYIAHYKPTYGIGELASFQGIPAERWETGIANAPEAPLIDRDIFTRLAGDVGQVCISNRGIRWDYITYQTGELAVLTSERGHSSDRKYDARRNPSDLGSIEVKDPYAKFERWITVPVCDAEAGHANGLKLHVHRAIVAYKKEQVKKANRDISLQDAREEMEASLVELHARRKKHRTAHMLARWYDGNVRKEERSRVVDMGRVEYTEGRLDLASMPDRAPPPRVNIRAVGTLPTPREPVKEPQPKAVATRTVSGEPIPSATFDKFDDGQPDDIADWDL